MKQRCIENWGKRKRELELLDLTNFIEDEMILVNDLIFTREAGGHYDKKHQELRNFRSTRRFTHAIIKDVVDKKEVTQCKTGNCPVFVKDNHDIEDCQLY